MCEMIVKAWYMFLWERSIGQFCTKLRDFRWYICPAKDVPMYPEKSLCKRMSFYIHFVHRSGLKLQSISQNVNQVLKMHIYVIRRCFSNILHEIQTIAYCSKFRIWGIGITFPYSKVSRDYVWYDCQTMRYGSKRGGCGTVLYQISWVNWYIWPWMNPETSLCETYVILGWFLHKTDPISLSMLQNVN